jgi:hypothetical protein
VLGRGFPEINWRSLPWREDQVVLAISHDADLDGINGHIEGIYWEA